MVKATNETRPVYTISNDYYALDIGMKQSILEELMKMFIADKRKIPAQLLSNLKDVRKENKRGEGYTLHTDCKNSRKCLKVFYKQYKHLDKYYPKKLDRVMSVGSLQRGQRAVDIEKKYEMLIRYKGDSHIWTYDDEDDILSWVSPSMFKTVKEAIKCGKYDKEQMEKVDMTIGDVKWYGIITGIGQDRLMLNYGLSSLANKMIYGFTVVFDAKQSRDDYYDWLMK
jgi:hypothetical protein